MTGILVVHLFVRSIPSFIFWWYCKWYGISNFIFRLFMASTFLESLLNLLNFQHGFSTVDCCMLNVSQHCALRKLQLPGHSLTGLMEFYSIWLNIQTVISRLLYIFDALTPIAVSSSIVWPSNFPHPSPNSYFCLFNTLNHPVVLGNPLLPVQ